MYGKWCHLLHRRLFHLAYRRPPPLQPPVPFEYQGHYIQPHKRFLLQILSNLALIIRICLSVCFSTYSQAKVRFIFYILPLTRVLIKLFSFPHFIQNVTDNDIYPQALFTITAKKSNTLYFTHIIQNIRI